MTKRKFEPNSDKKAQALVDSLYSEKAPSTEEYKQGMQELGRYLAHQLAEKLLGNKTQNLCVACTVEDADYLARGIIEQLEKDIPDAILSFACFWNEKSIDTRDLEEYDVAPILKSYKEPTSKDCTLIVSKSIISGACVVATNITNLIGELNPEEIYVVAPVMVIGAEDRLKKHFDENITDRFRYLKVASDDDRGSGPDIYERYGWKDSANKNQHTPQLVKDRRRQFSKQK